MRFLECISGLLKRYPYRERLPLAVLMCGVLTWHIYRKWPPSETAFIIYAALYCVLFLDRKGQPFWFLWGIVVGAGLVDLLPRLHRFLAH